MTAPRALAILATLIVLVGCTGTETGNPGAERSSGTVRAVSSSPADYAVVPETAPVVVERLWLSLRGIDFETCGGATIELLGEPEVVDLVRGRFNLKALTEAEYCMGDLAFAEAPANAADLEGTFVMVGTRADGLPFRIVSDTDTPLSIPFTPFGVGPSPLSVLVSVDVAAILTEIDLSLPEPDDDGIVRFDRQFSNDAYPLFLQSLESSITLHEDANRNGQLDADELEPF